VLKNKCTVPDNPQKVYDRQTFYKILIEKYTFVDACGATHDPTLSRFQKDDATLYEDVDIKKCTKY